ncbi:MAG: hypothetical protein K2Q23_20160 [Bryobacteraceae bacterium]|nr:hypothetical protein [Bryobacteraceae bacterium]
MAEEANAKKMALGEKEALALAESVDEIYSAKGKNVIHLRMKDAPGRDEILGALLGPTGNLRAPVLRRGKTLLVGYDETIYSRLLA